MDNKTSLFGFSVNKLGARVKDSSPKLICTSTSGGFRITGAVSTILGVASGEYIMFVSNHEEIDAAIATKHEVIVAFCDENGLDITSPEAITAIHANFGVVGIAKGFQEFNTNGTPKTVTERLTVADKRKIVVANFADIYAQAMSSDNLELVESLSKEDLTDEEKVEILTEFVQPSEVNSYCGSKTANSSGATGRGNILNFTDSSMWGRLKADLGEDADKLNRVYLLDLDKITKVALHNGYEVIEVSMIPLGEYTDAKPARIKRKSKDSDVDTLSDEEDLEDDGFTDEDLD